MLGDGGGGVAHGALLIDFAEAVVDGDAARIATCRDALAEPLGPAGLVDAAAVVAGFNAIDRIADSTGIPLDDATAEATVEMRDNLGLNAFKEGRQD